MLSKANLRRWISWTGILLWPALACEKSEEVPHAAPSAVAPSPTPDPPAEPPPPGPCTATGDAPAELAKIVGDVHGLALGGTHLYFSSWSVYGGRGNVGSIRTDGGGHWPLASLDLEPRGLALDEDTLYYTSGIRLLKVPKRGGEPTLLVEVFSSQEVAVDAEGVYGVPGDYGPYDRVARYVKKKREVEELTTGKRPKHDDRPNGFSRVIVHGDGVLVTDSGNGRVLRLPREGGKIKVLATNQDRAYDLAVSGSVAYFTLAKKGQLMSVPVEGGGAKRLAAGLVPDARVATGGDAVFSVFAGATDSDPQVIRKIEPATAAMTPIATVPALDPVVALAADGVCVYWAQRKSASETIVFARGHEKR
jgi:hypothetical protein